MKSCQRKHLHMHLFYENKNGWLLLMSHFSQTNSETKFHLTSPTKKTNVRIISFMVGRNVISGRFHLGSLVTPSKFQFSSHFVVSLSNK